jgi:hypothetical protein
VNEQAFIEDVLCVIYKQFLPTQGLPKPFTSKSYRAYIRAKNAGKRASIRIALIAKALQSRVSEIDMGNRFFLLVDNIDQCNPSLRDLLARELAVLQEKGLSIMLASRLPIYEKPKSQFCDYQDLVEDHSREILTFYWRCMNCEKYLICVQCKEQGRSCPKWYVFDRPLSYFLANY